MNNYLLLSLLLIFTEQPIETNIKYIDVENFNLCWKTNDWNGCSNTTFESWEEDKIQVEMNNGFLFIHHSTGNPGNKYVFISKSAEIVRENVIQLNQTDSLIVWYNIDQNVITIENFLSQKKVETTPKYPCPSHRYLCIDSVKSYFESGCFYIVTYKGEVQKIEVSI